MTLKFISDITQDKKYYYSLNRNQDFKFWVFFDRPQYLKYLIMYWIKSLVVLDKVTPAVSVSVRQFVISLKIDANYP